MNNLKVTSRDFTEGGRIPLKNSGRGEDISPCFQLEGIAPNAVSIAIILDDESHPIFPNYNHWVIWNIPVQSEIPGAIPYGKTVESLGGAVQGLAYGKHCYKGPKPPLNLLHNYIFTVFVLDCKLDLSPNSKKVDLLEKMQGHILQQAAISGKFQSIGENN